MKPLTILLIACCTVALIGGGIYVWYAQQKKSEDIPSQNVVKDTPSNIVAIEKREFPNIPDDDRDTDGLTAQEEVSIGTSQTSSDSDGDGISDYREVRIWKTDPLKKDTDGDGFSDFVDVMNGYNPIGEGTL